MSGEELFAGAMAAVRYDAAVELVRAVDTITLLEQLGHVAPNAFPISDADRAHVVSARANWDAVRA